MAPDEASGHNNRRNNCPASSHTANQQFSVFIPLFSYDHAQKAQLGLKAAPCLYHTHRNVYTKGLYYSGFQTLQGCVDPSQL